MAVTVIIKLPKPQSSPYGTVPIASVNQSMLPSFLAMKPSKLVATKTERAPVTENISVRIANALYRHSTKLGTLVTSCPKTSDSVMSAKALCLQGA